MCLRLAFVLACALASCGGGDATCAQACDNLYMCLPDTTTPKAECVRKCETDAGKGTPANRTCVAEKSCDDLRHGKCPDLIVR
jgi:hypothetical protein